MAAKKLVVADICDSGYDTNKSYEQYQTRICVNMIIITILLLVLYLITGCTYQLVEFRSDVIATHINYFYRFGSSVRVTSMKRNLYDRRKPPMGFRL